MEDFIKEFILMVIIMVVTSVQACTDSTMERIIGVSETQEVAEISEELETILTEEEKILIARVVFAEAGSEDLTGKRLIVDTILNRVRDDAFPSTVKGVVTQSHQYAMSSHYTQECMDAVELEMQGQIDYRVAWFCNSHYLSYGEPAFQHGGHWFNWISD